MDSREVIISTILLSLRILLCRAAEKEARAAEEAEIARKREEAKLRSYDTLFEAAGTAPTNREQSRDYKEAEDDFM